MVFYRHIPIVAYDIDTILFNSPWRKIPGTGITDIRFLQLLAIHQKSPVLKFNLFSLHGDHTLQEHHSVASEADRDHIKPFRLGEKRRQAPAEVYSAVAVRWLHADSLNDEWNAEMTKKKIGEKPDEEDPDQEPSC